RRNGTLGRHSDYVPLLCAGLRLSRPHAHVREADRGQGKNQNSCNCESLHHSPPRSGFNCILVWIRYSTPATIRSATANSTLPETPALTPYGVTSRRIATRMAWSTAPPKNTPDANSATLEAFMVSFSM